MKKALAFLIVLLSLITAAFAVANAEDEYFIICEPGCVVNVRISPDTHSEIIGCKFFGDALMFDRQKNGFVHITNLNSEYSEGWVYKGLISEDKPIEANASAVIVSNARVAGIKYVNGKIKRWLNNGTEVTVFAISEEWCVTDKGYVKAEFIEIREQKDGD